MFKVIVAMAIIGDECQTFEEAFKRFHVEVTKLVRNGTSLQILETACFIQYDFMCEGEMIQTALDFYGSAELAGEVGLLKDDGGLEERPTKEISVGDIQYAFMRNTAAQIDAMLEMVEDAMGVVVLS